MLYLNPGKPVSTGYFDPEDETLGEMIETIFPLDTDDLVLDWSGIQFELNYKYDISMMLEDILPLLQELRSTPNGNMMINWASSGFPYRWKVEWEQPDLEIHVLSYDSTDKMFKTQDLVRDSISHFIDEWITILEVVHSASCRAGYDVSKFPKGDILLSLLK